MSKKAIIQFDGLMTYVPLNDLGGDNNRVRVLFPETRPATLCQDGRTILPPHWPGVLFAKADFDASNSQKLVDLFFRDDNRATPIEMGMALFENDRDLREELVLAPDGTLPNPDLAALDTDPAGESWDHVPALESICAENFKVTGAGDVHPDFFGQDPPDTLAARVRLHQGRLKPLEPTIHENPRIEEWQFKPVNSGVPGLTQKLVKGVELTLDFEDYLDLAFLTIKDPSITLRIRLRPTSSDRLILQIFNRELQRKLPFKNKWHERIECSKPSIVDLAYEHHYKFCGVNLFGRPVPHPICLNASGATGSGLLHNCSENQSNANSEA